MIRDNFDHELGCLWVLKQVNRISKGIQQLYEKQLHSFLFKEF